MNHFTVTAFADEISEQVSEQLRVLKENGITHIEVRGLDGKNVSELTLEKAKKYKELFDEAGVQVSSIGSPIGKINIKDPFEDHLKTFQQVLKIATIFASPYVRMFSFFIDEGADYDQYEEAVIQRWQQFLAIAKEYPEITLLHENEKEIYGDTPERCLNLLTKLNSPQVKAAFDPANFVQCEVEVYPRAYELLKEQIAYVHIKDAKFSDHEVKPAGYGDGQVAEVLTQLTKEGFEGFASIEPHLTYFEGFAQLETGQPMKQEKVQDNVGLFGIASQALKKIIVEDLKQEWK